MKTRLTFILLSSFLLAPWIATPKAVAATAQIIPPSCPPTRVGGYATCTGGQIRAVGGSVTIGVYPNMVTVAGANASDFGGREQGGGCLWNMTLAAGQSCALAVTFWPSSVGTRSATFAAVTSSGASTPAVVIGGVGVAPGAAVVSVPNCPDTVVGSVVSCGSITVTASGGPIALTYQPPSYTQLYTASGAALAEFTLSAPTTNPCSSGEDLNSGATCNLATLAFRPQSSGARSATIAVTPISGGGTAGSGLLQGTGIPPFTYSWKSGSWEGCVGGSATWGYSAWSPTSGCGSLAQTRSATCNPDPNSGTEARFVGCSRSDGVTVADSECDSASRPQATRSCTPSSGYSCGVQAALNRMTELTDTCTYSWLAGGFGSCADGTAQWLAGEWSPTSGCGSTVQRRTLSCTVQALSGMRHQSVTCRRSDGNTVGDASCNPLLRPQGSEACTPSTVDCGALPPDIRSTVLTAGCPAADGQPYRGCVPDPAQGRYCIFTRL